VPVVDAGDVVEVGVGYEGEAVTGGLVSKPAGDVRAGGGGSLQRVHEDIETAERPETDEGEV
jgi:hypothetical protein